MQAEPISLRAGSTRANTRSASSGPRSKPDPLMATASAITIECRGCGRAFRLRPKTSKPIVGTVGCPGCGTRNAVDTRNADTRKRIAPGSTDAARNIISGFRNNVKEARESDESRSYLPRTQGAMHEADRRRRASRPDDSTIPDDPIGPGGTHKWHIRQVASELSKPIEVAESPVKPLPGRGPLGLKRRATPTPESATTRPSRRKKRTTDKRSANKPTTKRRTAKSPVQLSDEKAVQDFTDLSHTSLVSRSQRVADTIPDVAPASAETKQEQQSLETAPCDEPERQKEKTDLVTVKPEEPRVAAVAQQATEADEAQKAPEADEAAEVLEADETQEAAEAQQSAETPEAKKAQQAVEIQERSKSPEAEEVPQFPAEPAGDEESNWVLGDFAVVPSPAETEPVVEDADAGSLRTLLLVAAVLILGGAAVLVALQWNRGATEDDVPIAGHNAHRAEHDGSRHVDSESPALQPARTAVHGAAALAAARTIVADASDFVPVAVSKLVADARQLLGEEDAEAAVASARQAKALGLQTTEEFLFVGELLLNQKEFAEARQVLREGRDRFPREPRFRSLLQRAFEEDGHFLPRVDSLRRGDIDGIKRLGGGSTITLKFKKGRSTVAAFKPHQTRRQSNYRAEIAAWRLCQILECSFAIPYNRPVRIARPEFDSLYYQYDSGKQLAYASNFEDLIWQPVGDVDYIYGTEKEWVPDFTNFPIEKMDVWDHWLMQRTDLSRLDRPLSDSLRDWQEDPITEKHYRRVLERAGDLDTRGLARQLSDVLLFDFLIGNWDRFSTVKDWWGTNCNFGGGQIISIDNGAAFPTYTNSRVERRFMAVQRFSRSTIHELRLLDKDTTQEWLFPRATRHERQKFDRFWANRALVLGHVDKLIEKYGEDAVLAFE